MNSWKFTPIIYLFVSSLWLIGLVYWWWKKRPRKNEAEETASGFTMTKQELIDEFNAQADAALGLARELSSRPTTERTDRDHKEAIARCNTWRQAANRLRLLSEGE